MMPADICVSGRPPRRGGVIQATADAGSFLSVSV
jgi:hypothetical protein